MYMYKYTNICIYIYVYIYNTDDRTFRPISGEIVQTKNASAEVRGT